MAAYYGADGSGGGATPPPLPPVINTPTTTPATTVAAVLDSVDSITAPNIASFVVAGSLPAQGGYIWNNSLKVTIAEAPLVPATPPVGTVYYNNHTTHIGGTIFYIDTAARTVISPTSNFSTIAGVDYSTMFQFITHTGAFDSTHQFQNPNPLDKLSFLGNPNPTTAPVLTTPNPAIIGYIGANGVISTGGSYDVAVTFATVIGIPNWLQELRIFAIASGNKADNVANMNQFAVKGTYAPNASGLYQVFFHGLVAGSPYDLYVAFVDFQGNLSYGRYLITTAANPIQIGAAGQMSMGNPQLIFPSVLSHTPDIRENGIAGATAFDYLIPNATLDSLGYSSNPWLAEIQIVYRNPYFGTGASSKVLYGNSYVPQVSGTYNFIVPQLPVGVNEDGTIIQYDFGIRYMDYQGQFSNTVFFDGTQSNPLQIGSQTLQGIPSGTTFTVDFSGVPAAVLVNNGGGTFSQQLSFNLNITSSVPYRQWLDKIQLLAKEIPSGVPDNDQNPANYIKVGQITGSIYTNPVTHSFGPLGNNSYWQLAVQLIDHSGVFTQCLPIYRTGQQQTSAFVGPGATNTNFIGDSDMAFTANNGASVYWTYANFDPTRFHVIAPNGLFADAHGGALANGCAYSDVIQVVAGQTYSLSVTSNLDESNSGSQWAGIVSTGDKTANRVVPATIYAAGQLPRVYHGGGQVRTQLQWVASAPGITTGQVFSICIALYHNAISGSCNWNKPQFELGPVATGYMQGTAISNASATIAHAAQSTQVQNVINSAAQVSVSSVQTGSQLPLPNHAVAVNDVITDPGTGRGQLNITPVGGTSGRVPYANNNLGTNLGVGSGGSTKNGAFVACTGTVVSSAPASGAVVTMVTSDTGLILPAGGTWTIIATCDLSGASIDAYIDEYSSSTGAVYSLIAYYQSISSPTATNLHCASVFTTVGGQTIIFQVLGSSTAGSIRTVVQPVFEILAFRTGD